MKISASINQSTVRCHQKVRILKIKNIHADRQSVPATVTTGCEPKQLKPLHALRSSEYNDCIPRTATGSGSKDVFLSRQTATHRPEPLSSEPMASAGHAGQTVSQSVLVILTRSGFALPSIISIAPSWQAAARESRPLPSLRQS